jgi:hypothetical protein
MSRDTYTFMGPLSNQRFAASVLGFFSIRNLLTSVGFFRNFSILFIMTILTKCKHRLLEDWGRPPFRVSANPLRLI